jgi:hypothetical protein
MRRQLADHAASSPSHVWLFATDDTTGEPMILSHS